MSKDPDGSDTSDASPAEPTESSAVEALAALASDPHFPGFSACGHVRATEEGVLWNDTGHRTQIEQAVRLLAAVEPASQFLSLWSYAAFRANFFLGLWAADYRAPWHDYCSAIGVSRPLYTSHFYNPTPGNEKHYGSHTSVLSLLPRTTVPTWDETALSRIVSGHYDAAVRHDVWRDVRSSDDLNKAAWHLGVAAHYFTDLTQPMHAANFTNGFSFEGNRGLPNRDDLRHSRYEHLADEILLGKPATRARLLADPGSAAPAFVDDLVAIVKENATHAKLIFDELVGPLMESLGRAGRINDPITVDEGLPSLSRSFPAGQIATARFLQQWVRQSHDSNPSKRLRSDWVSVTMRRDPKGTLHPSMFYRRDGDLAVGFRFFDGTSWQNDETTFKELAGNGPNSATTFATVFDRGTDHPAVFLVAGSGTTAGQLSYWDAGPNGWRKTVIETAGDSRVRGNLVAVWDDRGAKPCAAYRGVNGLLHYVYWASGRFHVGALDGPKVAGAITAVWDPTEAGGDGKGHAAITYVAAERSIVHRFVRGGTWQQEVIVPAATDTHIDGMALVSAYDKAGGAVGVFWGQISYFLERVPESEPPLFYRRASFPQLQYTLMRAGAQTTVQLPIEAAGRIAATTGGRIGVHCRTATSDAHLACERDGESWVVRGVDGSIASMIAGGEGPGGESVIGWRSSDRSCQVLRYQSPKRVGE